MVRRCLKRDGQKRKCTRWGPARVRQPTRSRRILRATLALSGHSRPPELSWSGSRSATATESGSRSAGRASRSGSPWSGVESSCGSGCESGWSSLPAPGCMTPLPARARGPHRAEAVGRLSERTALQDRPSTGASSGHKTSRQCRGAARAAGDERPEIRRDGAQLPRRPRLPLATGPLGVRRLPRCRTPYGTFVNACPMELLCNSVTGRSASATGSSYGAYEAFRMKFSA